MGRKTVRFTKTGISKVPDNKPAVYRILTEGGGNNYTGVAKRGRVQERLHEHLGEKDHIPGARVQIEQVGSIAEARRLEAQIIADGNPKYNKQGT